MPEPTLRYWKDPEWVVERVGDRATIRLIIHHPATGRAAGLAHYAADTPDQESASRAALIEWANALAAERSP